MPYNDKYFFEFDTLKTANNATKYYRVVFSKLEDIAVTYDLVELTPSNSPFVLSYRSAEDFAFSPIKTSSAEINILYPYDASADVPQPELFFDASDEVSWRIQLYEITSAGTISTLKWQGFLIDNDVQYEWQDAYYYRMTATDNLAVLKDVKYSDVNEFRCPDYAPLEGVSVKDFVIELVNNTGNTLNYKFAWNLYNNGVEITLDALFTSKYSAIDWSKLSPYDCNKVLNDLLISLGCIIYQDNNDATWTILNVAEIGTRTDNEVPYISYDSTGTLITTGVIEFNSSINTGATDLVWRDKNQIVSLKRPLGSVDFIHPYVMKNLLDNYSFQEDLIHSGWADNGTFNSTVGTDAYGVTGITYDKNILSISSSEDIAGSVDVSNYFYQNINLSNTEVINVNTSDFWSVYLDYESFADYQSALGGSQAYNFQITFNRTAPLNDIFYDLSEPTSIDVDGVWTTWAEARIPVWSTDGSALQKVNLYTKYTKLYNETETIGLRYLKYRKPFGSGGSYAIDSVRLCITPVTYKLVTEIKFKAYKNLKYQKKDFKTIYTGGYNLYDWYVLEGALGLKDINNKLYCNGLWDRHFEVHDESSFNYLQAIVSKSILSFYRGVSRKFTGNIWGEQISYPKYFEIDQAQDLQYIDDILTAYQTRLDNDAADIENTFCGSNYLTEFAGLNSKFLMVEATFDYANSTTSVNLHEDLTSTSESNFEAGFAGFTTSPNGILPGSFGSSTQGQEVPTEPS
jgi:hypothetical protein